METDPLLDALFCPEEEGLEPALAALRRRRRVRKIMPAAIGAGFASIIIAVIVLRAGLEFHSAPLTETVVQTVTTRSVARIEIVHTSKQSVEVVTTAAKAEAPAKLTDGELLTAFAPGRAALAGIGSETRLIQF